MSIKTFSLNKYPLAAIGKPDCSLNIIDACFKTPSNNILLSIPTPFTGLYKILDLNEFSSSETCFSTNVDALGFSK
jgi:hypothetical protein